MSGLNKYVKQETKIKFTFIQNANKIRINIYQNDIVSGFYNNL